jgi:5-methylcytosine-specific restriction endonuclease McrA
MSGGIEETLAELVSICERYSFNLEEELRRKVRELRWRAFLKSRTNDLLVRELEYESFLTLVFRRAPTLEEITHARTALVGRRANVSSETKEYLRDLQNHRCRHCGRMLTTEATEHVDHIRPVAFGGDTNIENLRIICQSCNLAKSDLLDWTLGRIFDQVWNNQPSSFVRYAVLARDESTCTTPGCRRTWRDEELRVSRVIPERRGGRAIFDNLSTICLPHFNVRYINSEPHFEMILD